MCVVDFVCMCVGGVCLFLVWKAIFVLGVECQLPPAGLHLKASPKDGGTIWALFSG